MRVILWLIDLIMGIPHILLLILISVAVGRGLKGIIIGVACTHWPSLARLIRAEVLQLRESQYIRIAGKLGMSKWEHCPQAFAAPFASTVHCRPDSAVSPCDSP